LITIDKQEDLVTLINVFSCEPQNQAHQSWFREMAKYAKPDAHLYEVCYLLDKTERHDR